MFFETDPSRSGAVISLCQRYRYELWRRWEAGPELCYVMLNPSTADTTDDDASVRRCIGLAVSAGYSGIRVVNLFAFRSRSPERMRAVRDPHGPDNQRTLARVLSRCVGHQATLVFAWGAHAAPEDSAAVELLAKRLAVTPYCFGTTSSGAPRHPLMLRRASILVPWRGWKEQTP